MAGFTASSWASEKEINPRKGIETFLRFVGSYRKIFFYPEAYNPRKGIETQLGQCLSKDKVLYRRPTNPRKGIEISISPP